MKLERLEEQIRLEREAKLRQETVEKATRLEEEVELKRAEAEYQKRLGPLNKRADKLLLPILEEANKLLADNSGQIGSKILSTRNVEDDVYSVRRELTWDFESGQADKYSDYEKFKTIELHLDEGGNVGVNKKKILTNIEQENWKDIVEEEIIKLHDTGDYKHYILGPENR